VHDHEAADVVDAMPTDERGDRHAGLVDVGLREREHDPFAVDPGFGDEGAFLPALETLAMAGRQQADDVGTEVVTGTTVFRLRVAEADDQQVGRCPRPGAEQVLPLGA
jgi:hypothetical protein